MRLLKSLFGAAGHHSAQLPYNLNWGTKASRLAPLLTRFPLSVFDVSARAGVIPELEELASFAEYVGFGRRPASSPSGFRRYRIFPYFLGNESGPVDFHVYDNPVFSSVFEIDPEFNRAFLVPPVRLERRISLTSSRLDDVVAREGLEAPDLLNLDTRGSELAVLQGGLGTLAGTLLVATQVKFYPEYRGQALFSEIDRFLKFVGFELLYLDRSFQQRKGFYRGIARGQLIFGDALYGRNPASARAMAAERAAKYIVLLCHYGHLDLARQILDEHGEAGRAFPELAACFGGVPGPARRGFVSQIDKVICLLLHLRKTNHRSSDSDRSWPVR
jgi:FkbM family methyltransferase